MNKIYRLKFSKRLNQLVAVSEITSGHDRNSGRGHQSTEVVGSANLFGRLLKLKPLSALLSVCTFGFAVSAYANGLQGMDVVSGSATMQVNGKHTVITNSPDAIINWQQFNINADELVRFVQENANSAVFNRVTSSQVSDLKGTLSSNGKVFLINPNGIIFGKNSVVDTAGFVASTLNLADEDIKRGVLNFEQVKDKAMAQIVNNGLITVAPNGTVALVGGSVTNNGVIRVENGNVLLQAGQRIVISDLVNPTVTYSVSAPSNQAVNLGEIFAKNGTISLGGGNVSNQGVLDASSLSKQGGKIVLLAKEDTAKVGGTLNLAGEQGGSLLISGKKVVLTPNAHINLNGQHGGGIAYIGGDEQGKGVRGIQLAQETHIQQGAVIHASATDNGNGGRVIVWGDRAQIDGIITARGGEQGGKGGFVETSGHYLGIAPNARVDVRAANGAYGDWLLDPYNVTITDDETLTPPTFVDQNGEKVLVPVADMTISARAISEALKNGAKIKILTYNPADKTAGSSDGNIEVRGNITMTGDKYASLTLDAVKNITIAEHATISGPNISDGGKLDVSLIAGDKIVVDGKINRFPKHSFLRDYSDLGNNLIKNSFYEACVKSFEDFYGPDYKHGCFPLIPKQTFFHEELMAIGTGNITLKAKNDVEIGTTGEVSSRASYVDILSTDGGITNKGKIYSGSGIPSAGVESSRDQKVEGDKRDLSKLAVIDMDTSEENAVGTHHRVDAQNLPGKYESDLNQSGYCKNKEGTGKYCVMIDLKAKKDILNKGVISAMSNNNNSTSTEPVYKDNGEIDNGQNGSDPSNGNRRVEHKIRESVIGLERPRLMG